MSIFENIMLASVFILGFVVLFGVFLIIEHLIHKYLPGSWISEFLKWGQYESENI